MAFKPKFKVTAYYFSKKMGDMLEQQIKDKFFIDNRHLSTFAYDFKRTEYDSSAVCKKFDELGTIEFFIAEDSEFIPYVSYRRITDNFLKTIYSNELLIAAVIITDYEEDKMYDRVGEPTHMQFAGLQDYISSEIVINVDEYPGECRVYFFKGSDFYPEIGIYY